MTFSDPEKKYALAVRLEFGGSELPNPDVINIDDTPTVLLLTSYTATVTVDGEDYLPAPETSVTFGKLSGALDEDPTEVDILGDYLLPEMTSGPFSPVEIEIREFVTGAGGDEFRVAYRGWTNKFIRNPDGHRRTVRLRCFTDKQRLERELCMPADHQCVWHLFGPGCTTVNTNTGPPSAPTQGQLQGPLVEDYISACAVDTIDGTTVTVTDLMDVGTSNGDLWQAGYLEHRGLRIGIRDWDKDATTPQGGGLVTTDFQLVKQPPPSWLGAVVRAVPGCPKFVEECRLRYDNEKNICNPGAGIKPYNPMIESP